MNSLENRFSKSSLQLPYSTNGNGMTSRAANPEGGAASHSPHQPFPKRMERALLPFQIKPCMVHMCIYVNDDSPK